MLVEARGISTIELAIPAFRCHNFLAATNSSKRFLIPSKGALNVRIGLVYLNRSKKGKPLLLLE